MKEFDVIIVGGGLVGASLALALSGSRHRVALLEAAAPPSGAPSWDERCIALNAASQAIFSALGAWEELAPAAEPIRSTHISERGRFGVARFTAEEAGLPALGYNIPVRQLGTVLWRRAQGTNTTLLCPTRLSRLQLQGDGVELELEGGERLSAKLVVAADGAHSAVRTMLGIGHDSRDYEQSAIVTAVRVSRPHQGCAYERFTPDGPIALLPKPDGACSLVWTVPARQVDGMLACSDEAFLAQAQDTFGERLGRFVTLGRRNAHPLSRVMSERLTVPRVLFAGNAAQSLHPVAAQGFNLGLRDVAAVAEALEAAVDPGAAALLRDYEAARQADRERVSQFTDRLVRSFSNRLPGFSALRHLGLLALDLTPPLKQAVMWQNLGYGHAPRMAREGQP
ncbi:2-octaprenyl-6-methoxyphenyl hydroxylase [Solimonas sp. K1W22B-7]|uniref:2-octaprenyl-6-methoxyphenyl hydroxylase n=1 Tax=Solimonas sp. K1W22B-7 TaxID=2303331 RepID=UPI000E3353DF|nr:2-octaprenyl-6-methoxyphenyl hydroxylase [Solimonas sp. K1W22B-7]AXQ29788.1 2-octaprenyl-6-methoxyphenyl hydroxylase [Solimonas sp. K1W22B-7]